MGLMGFMGLMGGDAVVFFKYPNFCGSFVIIQKCFYN